MIDPALQPYVWDWAIIAALTLALPTFTAFYTIPKLRKMPREKLDSARPALYIEVMAIQWVFAGVALYHCLQADVSLSDLGLSFEFSFGFAAAAGVVALLIGFLFWQRRAVRAAQDGRAQVKEAVGHIAWLIPRTKKEKRLWYLLSLHAGIGEELFFRGFLLAALNWYLPLWAACLMMTVMFGLGHMYQGVRGIVQTTIAGAVLLGLYLLSGSLWLSMLAHAWYDVSGGMLGHWALYGGDDEPHE